MFTINNIIKLLLVIWLGVITQTVFASYELDRNSTSDGASLWGESILQMTASLDGSNITVTVLKIDSSFFTSSGTMYLKVGSYQVFGSDRDTGSVVANVTNKLFFTHNLDDYDSSTYPKEFYFRYESMDVKGNPDGGWAWVGPIQVSYNAPA
ncbi:hypothetical protein QUF74_19220 [Candidatus Halobeggiatoa sp. HSG11]|nr:hypothetical protein [Candidatus Halobeggiatoa sp. HSG11]